MDDPYMAALNRLSEIKKGCEGVRTEEYIQGFNDGFLNALDIYITLLEG